MPHAVIQTTQALTGVPRLRHSQGQTGAGVNHAG
jgi:hypothetical protein